MPPLFMREISLTLDDGVQVAPLEFKCDVHAATIEPQAGDVVTYVTLCPDGTYSQRAATTYILHLVGVQNWDAAGLAKYLDEHDGVELSFIYQAHGVAANTTADQPAKQGTCVGMAPTYGGERDTWAEYDVELPISGTPDTLTAPPAAFVAREAVGEGEPRGKAKATAAA
jgi:hypothetical protein